MSDKFNDLVNFIDYINENYKNTVDDRKNSVINKYIDFAKRDMHKEFEEFIKESLPNAFLSDSVWELRTLAKHIAPKLSPKSCDLLAQVVKKPCRDNELIWHERELYSHGILVHICDCGEFGYNAVSELGWYVHNELHK